MLRRPLLRAAQSDRLRSVVETAPVSRSVVRRFVAGLDADAALGTAGRLAAVGQALGKDGERVALANAQQICAAAMAAGTTVTLDMEDHTTTDSTLAVL